MNGFATATAVLLGSGLLAGGAALATPTLVVDVRVEDGPRIVAPVPVFLARAGLALAPQDARLIEAPEAAAHLADIQRIVAALGEAPDGVFVEVEGRGDRVVVSKRGDVLHLIAEEPDGALVKLRLPIAAMASLPEAYDAGTGAFRTAELLSALRAAPHGPLLDVVDGGTEVSVRVW